MHISPVSFYSILPKNVSLYKKICLTLFFFTFFLWTREEKKPFYAYARGLAKPKAWSEKDFFRGIQNKTINLLSVFLIDDKNLSRQGREKFQEILYQNKNARGIFFKYFRFFKKEDILLQVNSEIYAKECSASPPCFSLYIPFLKTDLLGPEERQCFIEKMCPIGLGIGLSEADIRNALSEYVYKNSAFKIGKESQLDVLLEFYQQVAPLFLAKEAKVLFTQDYLNRVKNFFQLLEKHIEDHMPEQLLGRTWALFYTNFPNKRSTFPVPKHIDDSFNVSSFFSPEKKIRIKAFVERGDPKSWHGDLLKQESLAVIQKIIQLKKQKGDVTHLENFEEEAEKKSFGSYSPYGLVAVFFLTIYAGLSLSFYRL